MPAQIDAQPTEDVGTISFLGTQVATKYPEVRSWVAPTPAAMPYESQVQRKGEYQPLRQLSLESMFPMVQGYRDSVAGGVAARFSDPMGFDSAAVELSYSPDSTLPSNQRTHFSADLRHSRWTTGVAWNEADFYDLFGPTKRSFAGYNGYIGYNLPLDFEPPKLGRFLRQGGLLRRSRYAAWRAECGRDIEPPVHR